MAGGLAPAVTPRRASLGFVQLLPRAAQLSLPRTVRGGHSDFLTTRPTRPWARWLGAAGTWKRVPAVAFISPPPGAIGPRPPRPLLVEQERGRALHEALVALGRESRWLGEHHPAGRLAQVPNRAGGQLHVEVPGQLAAVDPRLHQGSDPVEDPGSVALDMFADDRRGALERQQDEPPGGGALQHDLEEAPHARGEDLGWVAVVPRLGHHLLQLLQRVALLPFHERVEQPPEVGEVVVDHRAGHASLARHRLDRDTAVALLQDHLERRVDQLLAALFGRHARRVASPRRLDARGRRVVGQSHALPRLAQLTTQP